MDIFNMDDKRGNGLIQVLRTEPHITEGVLIKEKNGGCIIQSRKNKTFLQNHYLSPIVGLDEDGLSGWTVMPDDFFTIH